MRRRNALPCERAFQGSASAPLESFRHSLAAFEHDLEAAGALSTPISDQLAALQLALEEVQVADEALARQSDELIAAREDLESERRRYRDLFQFAPYGYLTTDLSGTIGEANQSALELLQISPHAIRGKPLAVFIAGFDVPRFRALFARIEAGEAITDWEVTLHPRHRPLVPALLNVSRLKAAHDRTDVLLWAVRDLSAVKATEAALQASEERLRHAQRLEAVGRLAGGIAHSFNNLLAAMTFHVDLLGERLAAQPEGEALGRHVDEIRRMGERAAGLASQLLAFSRRQVLQPQPMRLNDVLEAMRPMVGGLLGEQIELDLRLAADAGTIHFDLTQLEQVLLNLFVNARDAMPEGGRLTVETSALELGTGEGDPSSPAELAPGAYARLAVTDTGIGMSAEVKARIFEPFFTTKERGKGTGLGLSTVHGIVKQSGGDVRVESTEGQGTRVEVYLPCSSAEPEPLARPQPVPERRGASEVILLVEDEKDIRLAASEVLEAQGYRVIAAADGAQALRLGAELAGPLDLLVTDVVMPGMNGRQLAEQLMAARPDLRVLYMSGYPEDAIADQGLFERGTFLQKPFPVAQFLQTIRQVLDRAPAPAPGEGRREGGGGAAS